jgi:hypothetical protein
VDRVPARPARSRVAIWTRIGPYGGHAPPLAGPRQSNVHRSLDGQPPPGSDIFGLDVWHWRTSALQLTTCQRRQHAGRAMLTLLVDAGRNDRSPTAAGLRDALHFQPLWGSRAECRRRGVLWSPSFESRRTRRHRYVGRLPPDAQKTPRSQNPPRYGVPRRARASRQPQVPAYRPGMTAAPSWPVPGTCLHNGAWRFSPSATLIRAGSSLRWSVAVRVRRVRAWHVARESPESAAEPGSTTHITG